MAMRQTNIRRLIAYASIAHMGFTLLPLQVVSKEGLAGSLIYMMGYIATTVVAFILLSFKDKGIESGQIIKGNIEINAA